jgi:uncharacterized membrane protein
MAYLLAGLLLFLGVHSLRIFAEAWRAQQIGRIGPLPWKGLVSVLSLAGFALLVWGWGMARQMPVVLWQPPVGMRHAASLLTLLSFVLLAAAYVPGNAIKARFHHPMVLGVKTWALAHLLSNGNLADVILFGGFLLWSVLNFKASRARDRATAETHLLVVDEAEAPVSKLSATLISVVAGAAVWGVIAFVLHAKVVGVSPMG